MNKHQIFVGGITAAILMTLLYALESYFFGIFVGAPLSPLGRFLGSWWMLIFSLSNAVTGIILSIFYTLLSRGFKGSRPVRGAKFGASAWLVGSLLFVPLVYFNIALPFLLLASWVFGLLINMLIAGAVIGLLVDVRE